MILQIVKRYLNQIERSPIVPLTEISKSKDIPAALCRVYAQWQRTPGTPRIEVLSSWKWNWRYPSRPYTLGFMFPKTDSIALRKKPLEVLLSVGLHELSEREVLLGDYLEGESDAYRFLLSHQMACYAQVALTECALAGDLQERTRRATRELLAGTLQGSSSVLRAYIAGQPWVSVRGY